LTACSISEPGNCSRSFVDGDGTATRGGIDEALVEKTTDINVITGFGVLMTPASAVDGEVKSSGRVLSPRGDSSVLGAARSLHEDRGHLAMGNGPEMQFGLRVSH
jgi:hypothetical protein